MRTILSTTLSALALLGCESLNQKRPEPSELIKLVSPNFKVTAPNSRFVGGLDIYTCSVGTDRYLGNYIDNPPMLRTQPAVYVVDSTGAMSAYPPLMMPLDTYTLLYWGVAHNADTVYRNPLVERPNIKIGANLGAQALSLTKYKSDTTYSPTYDFVYALRNMALGSDSISVPLTRKVAGIKIIVRNSNGAPFSSAIRSITAQVGGVTKSLNFFTGQAQGAAVTVSFPLTIAANRTTAQNRMAMLFPSTPHPPLNLIVDLANGSQRVLRASLTNALTEGSRLTVNIQLNEIIASQQAPANIKISNSSENMEPI